MTLKKNKSFISIDPPSHKGKSNSWYTPLWLVNELGDFDLDPCGKETHETAKKIYEYPYWNGLQEIWRGRVWLNPPYGKEQKIWMERLKDHGDGIALLFGRLETNWIQPFIQDGFFQLRGRIKFLDENFNEQSNAGAPSILIPFGRKNIGSILSSDLKGKWFQ